MEEIIASFKPYHFAVTGILLAAFAVQLFYYLHYYRKVLAQSRKIRKGKHTFSDKQPPVSVIVCAKNESDNLREFLPSVLTQDYPNYQVVVVNDGSSDESKEILALFAQDYPHLYHTYLPEDAKFISTKKMSLTVGIKAAKYDIILLTDADCQPAGKDWITNIVRNFDEKTDVVLSYGAYFNKKNFLSRLISYDTFTIALQYMGFALAGKPYMGVGRNLAYRKHLFFDNKGFASHLHLQSGDDDLFIKEVATKRNTRVETSPESITFSVPKSTFKKWRIQKSRHLTTAPYYRFGTRLRIGLEIGSRFLFYAAIIALFAMQNLWLAIFAGGIYILRALTQLLVINRTARRMNERRFYLTALLFDILLPLVTLWVFLFCRKKSKIKW
ncbi:MAG: glycosyltransferase [Prevotellaceae bacterium]|jgi:cellulose synthase/poly-beta-1,6-N-acetylglucosamine synthase-like glycosyltransferase|nr:glycosyltransferase [Prevotellaceae bacterium]